jgi:hypothetical protein
MTGNTLPQHQSQCTVSPHETQSFEMSAAGVETITRVSALQPKARQQYLLESRNGGVTFRCAA